MDSKKSAVILVSSSTNGSMAVCKNVFPGDIWDLIEADLWGMSSSKRSSLHESWLQEIRDPLIANILNHCTHYETTKCERDKVSRDVDLRCVQDAEVVGSHPPVWQEISISFRSYGAKLYYVRRQARFSRHTFLLLFFHPSNTPFLSETTCSCGLGFSTMTSRVQVPGVPSIPWTCLCSNVSLTPHMPVTRDCRSTPWKAKDECIRASPS